MGILTSSVKISLIDDVSKPARSVAQALREAVGQMRNVNKSMGGSGSAMGDAFKKQLAGLNLTKKELAQVRLEWMRYAQAERAALGTDWMKKNAAGVRAWKSQVISATKAARREQIAEAKATMAIISGGRGEGGMGRGRKFISESARDFASGMVMGSIPMMAGMKAYEGGKELIKGGMAYQHEKIALLNAGRTISELNEMEEAAKRAAKAVPTSSIKENLAILNETTGAFGSTEHAIENLEFMARMSSVIKNSVGDKVAESSGEMGNKFARFFEMRGAAQNQAKMQAEGEDLVRAMIFSRGNFNPSEMLNFAQQAKSAVMMNYNREFLTSVMPSLVTEFGGERAGTKASAFFGTITGKARDKKQAQAWIDAGLLNRKMLVDADKTGNNAIGWKAGAVKDTDLALRNPYEWAGKVLIPALQKAGVNTSDSASVTKYLATMFRNSNANDFAQVIVQALSRQRIDKDAALMKQTGTGREVMERSLSGDPTMAATAVSAAFENLSAAVMKSAPIASGLNLLAASINGLGSSAENGALKALSNPSGWLEDTKSRWGRVAEVAAGWWNKYRGVPGAFSAPTSAEFSKNSIQDTRLSFSKLGSAAHARRRPWAQEPGVSPFGATGGMGASSLPAFAQMTVKPTIDTSGLDHLLLKAESAHVAVEGLNISVSPNVNVGSLDAAIAKGNQLLSILGAIGVAASNASASVGAAAGRASAGAANIKTSAAVARNNYVDGGVQGGN